VRISRVDNIQAGGMVERMSKAEMGPRSWDWDGGRWEWSKKNEKGRNDREDATCHLSYTVGSK
jgi:hypothetical protein